MDGDSTGTSAGNTTTTTSGQTPQTNTGSGSGSSGSSMEIDAQQLRHWASPEELLSIKNLLGDLRLRHNQEMQTMTSSLEQARAENEVLRRDAAAFGRLKDAYLASERDFERMKSERSAWHEEREMLVLKLQEASNEILRLKQMPASQRGGSSSSSGGGSVPSGFTGSSSSSSSALTATTAANEKFVLALAESEHRRECEMRELNQRLDFQQITHDMARQRMQQRVAAAEAELRVTKEKLNGAKDKGRSLQSQCDHAEIKFNELEAVAAKRIGEMEADLRAAQEGKDKADKALEAQRSEADKEREQLVQAHKSKVDALLQESSGQAQTLTQSLNRAVATASRADDVFSKEREQLLQELRDVNEMLRMERSKADNTAQQLSQRLQVLSGERDDLQGQLHESQTECSKLRTRLDVCSDTISALRNEIDELHAGMVRTQNVEGAVALKERQLQQIATARDTFEARAIHAEHQARTVAAALERERSQSLVALELLQKQREEREAETERAHRRVVERMERKYRDTKIRLRELVAWREANEPMRPEPVLAAPAAAQADALATMYSQFEAASALAKGMSG